MDPVIRARAALRWLVRAMFIVPRSQVEVFDLGYQLYAFDLFHAHPLNRASHYVGIPISLAATYALEAHVSYVSSRSLRERGYVLRGAGFGR